jgi:phosphoribosylamine--glycine ligase
MTGEELSVFAVTDGNRFAFLAPSQDHKRLLEGDRGPNTGGMGAYAPVSIATREVLTAISSAIIAPVLAALAEAGAPFSGLLYAGLMLTESGPRVVEFNSRFGDPETQVVLPVMGGALLPLLMGAAGRGDLPRTGDLIPVTGAAVTIVMASAGYPGSTRTGDHIHIPDALPDGVTVFHAGTAMDAEHRLVTAGGRVLSVTGVGPSLDVAHVRSEEAVRSIHFDGCQWRQDIGWRELRRLSVT